MNANPSGKTRTNDPEFEAVVIGTGFGGAVTACRLVQAGFKVCVLERGRRYGPDDFPVFPNVNQFTGEEGDKNSYTPTPDLSRWFWTAGQGLWDVRDLDQVIVAQAAGYGGGSLIYANVHLRAPDEVFDPHYWPRDIYNRSTLKDYYDLVAYMLDVNPIPSSLQLAKTTQLHRAADRKFRWFTTPLAINFAKEGKNKFERWQNKCDMRGHCWQGCGAQAKNTLDLNYLALVENAERNGEQLADIRTMAEVTSFWQIPGSNPAVYKVEYKDHLDGRECSVTAKYVFLCAGAINSTELLLKMQSYELQERRVKYRGNGLGKRYHPNADSFAVVFDCEQPQEADYGPTITSALLYDEDHPERWTLEFKKGEFEPAVGDIITQPNSDAQGVLADPPLLYGGSWGNATAEGRLIVTQVQGEFSHSGILSVLPQDGVIAKVVSTQNIGDGRVGIHFKDGKKEPSFGDIIIGQPSGALGTMFHKPTLESGSWEGKDARGTMVLGEVKGDFGDGEFLKFPDETIKKGREMGLADSPAVRLKDWFLVEEGGYPSDLEPLLGVFRSPLWLRRNRFWEKDSVLGDTPIIGDDTRQSRLPVRAIEEFFTAVPRRVVPSTGILARTFSQSRGLFSSKVTDEFFTKGDIWQSVLPEWLKEALRNDREQLAEYLAFTGEPLVGRMLDETVGPMLKRFDLKELAGGLDIGTIQEKDQRMIVRGLLRQSIQLMWGSEADMGRHLSRVLLEQFPQNLEGLLGWIPRLLCWALDYRPGDGRTAMLLLMGRDIYPGTLSWEEKDGKAPRLKASLPEAYRTSVWPTQERVLRQIAKTWKGELRTNPAWTFLNRQVTVHSQGGCAMAPNTPDPLRHVTLPDGQVIDCPGLYVMDASAFPTPVGVNPSATIAAIAEFKIEQFIRNTSNEYWEAPQKKEAKDWARKRPYLEQQELYSNEPKTAYKDQDPVGLIFKETMEGFHSPSDYNEGGIDWTDPKTIFNVESIRNFEKAEAGGIATGGKIETKLTAEIKDLSHFLTRHQAGHIEKVEVTGVIKIEGRLLEEVDSDVSGYIQLFLPADSEKAIRIFKYELRFKHKNNAYVIHAAKALRDDPGFDVWHDTATLYFDLFQISDGNLKTLPPRQSEILIRRGILRLPATNFFQQQLSSFEVTNTTDSAKKSWALAAFGKFFFGEIVEVYLPELDRAIEALKNVLKRTYD